MVDARLMISTNRTALPRWEISGAGEILGWVQESKIGRTRRRFFHAYGVHPTSGKTINLENHPDLDHAVEVVRDFRSAPETYSRHII